MASLGPTKRLKQIEATLVGPSRESVPLAVGTLGVLLCIVSSGPTENSKKTLENVFTAEVKGTLWPGPRVGSSLTATDKYLYLYGGVADFPGWGPHFDSVYLSDMWRFDIAQGVWELLGPLPALQYLATHCFIEEHHAVENTFWINRPSFFITFTPSIVPATLHAVDSPFLLDGPGVWPDPRGGHVLTKGRVAEELILYGGIRKSGQIDGALRDGSVFFDHVYKYNTRNNAWTLLSIEGGPAVSLAAGHVLQNRLYICGGCGSGDHCHSLSVFDLQQKKWLSNIKRYAAFERIRHGCTLFGTQLIVYGGSTASRFDLPEEEELTSNVPMVSLDLETLRLTYNYPFDRETDFENHSLVSLTAEGSEQPHVLLFGGMATTLRNGLKKDNVLLRSIVANKSFDPVAEYLNVKQGRLSVKKPGTWARRPLEGSLNDLVTYVMHGVWLFEPSFNCKLENVPDWITPMIKNYLP